MTRYVIRNSQGLLYTYNDVPETVAVPRPNDPSRNDLVSKLIPVFDTMNPIEALKFEERSDAEQMLSHPDLVNPLAFAGCEVAEAEFDRGSPRALR